MPDLTTSAFHVGQGLKVCNLAMEIRSQERKRLARERQHRQRQKIRVNADRSSLSFLKFDPSCFLFLSQQYLDCSFLSIVSAEQRKQATIFPQQLCHSLPQTFLTFTVVQNPCRPHSKAMPNLRFDGNATIS